MKFVENVNVEKTRVSNSSDLVDVTFKIKERKAGEFKVSAGWSDTDGAIFDIDLQQFLCQKILESLKWVLT